MSDYVPMTNEEFQRYASELGEKYLEVSTQSPTPEHLAEITSRILVVSGHPLEVILLPEIVRLVWMDGYGVGRNAKANGLRLDLPEKNM